MNLDGKKLIISNIIKTNKMNKLLIASTFLFAIAFTACANKTTKDNDNKNQVTSNSNDTKKWEQLN